jgi:gliding motility-associated-like protein
MNAAIIGSAPSNPNCGTNGSPLVGAVDTAFIEPPFPFNSTISPYLADNINFLPQVITDQRIQILYLAQDLLVGGLQPGVISELAFDVSIKNSTRPFRGFNISLGCTNATALNGTTWLPTDPVFSADSVSTALGWNNYVLDSTFDWDGISNLVVEVCWDNVVTDFPNGIDNVNADFMGYIATHTAIGTAGQGCSFAPNANNLFTTRPNIRFTSYPPAPGPVNFVWDLTNTLSDPFIQNPIADPFVPETYVVTATFANGCVLQDSVFVDIFQFSSSLTDDLSICEGDTITLVADAGGGARYVWDSVAGMSCLDCPNPSVAPDTITTYYVRMIASNGCWIRDSVTVDPAGLQVDAWFRDTLVDQGDTLLLGANVSSSLPGLTYTWQPSTFLNDSSLASPTAIPIQDVLPYILTVSAGDCEDTTAINVRVNIIESPYNMPNAFTPNGDGLNDVFYPLVDGLAEVTSFKVYNRWGALLHNDPTTGWDGSYKGEIQPADTYVFYVEIRVPFQEDQFISGTVEIIR